MSPDDRPGPPPRLVLLHREGCHLCEDMEALLVELLEPGSFVLTRVDVDERPELLAEHHARVPVLSIETGGESVELCHHFLDLAAVRSALAGYNRPAGPSRARRPGPPPAPSS